MEDCSPSSRTGVNEEPELSSVLDAARSGSRDALAELYRLYAAAVITLAYRITGSREDAEDVLQDVFVGLRRALASYHHEGRFESWLKRVAARTALMRMRAGRRRAESSLSEELADTVTAAEPAGSAAARVIDRLEMQRVLERLPQSLRAVFLLKEVEGYSHDEIGALLDISAAASATRLSRAWSLLRRELER